MATTIGNLSVALTARTDKFDKGLNRSAAGISKWAKKIHAEAVSAAKYLAGAAVGAAVAVGYMTHRAMESIDATAKMSDRLGIATESLLELRHGANLAGVSADELETAMAKLSKGLGDPKKGLALPIYQLGLSLDDLMKQDPATRLGTIADAINKLKTQEEKAAAATALFGRAGGKLLPFLELGSQGFKDSGEEARKLGLIYGRVSAAQVEQANDAMTRLGGLVTGFFLKLAVAVSPFVQAISKAMTNFGTDGRNAADVILEGIVNILNVMVRITDLVNVIRAGFYAIKSISLSIGATWQRLEGNTRSIVAWWKSAISLPSGGHLGGYGKNGEHTGAAAAIAAQNARADNERLEKAMRDGADMAGHMMKDSWAKFLNRDASTSVLDWFKKAKKDSLNEAQNSVRDRNTIKGGSALADDPRTSAPQTRSRGTFSGEISSRLVGTLSIQEKMLDVLRGIKGGIDDFNDALDGGFPVGGE